MTTSDILSRRLSNQQLDQSKFTRPEDVVRWLGAVQSQDYPGAKWALGQRLSNSTDETIEQAFTEGKILRTHVMRPTWHFVHPEDIRWMLELTAPRISKLMGHYNKLLELDENVFTKAHNAIIKNLKGKSLTRQELKTELDRIGITTNVQRLAHIVMEAEIRCLVVNGSRRGNQFTYMLFDERVPKAKKLTRDEALTELTKRYFTSHGPAQIQDFVWWSGLTTVDAKHGLELNKNTIVSEEVDGKTYYFSPNTPNPPNLPKSAVYLLPNYDEFTIGYRDRSAFYDASSDVKIYSMGALAYPHVILYKGRVIGTWRRTQKKDNLIIEPNLPEKLSDEIKKKLQEVTGKYSNFLDSKVTVKD